MNKTIIITGGAGFIGSHVVRLFTTKYPNYKIVNLDALTYAGNLQNLKDIDSLPNYFFEKCDITDSNAVDAVFLKHKPDAIIHLAAESHVDRSISDPMAFVMTNVIGTCNLLNAAKNTWKNNFEGKLFYHVSTDEVYGELHDENEFFLETTSYDPRSPYSASKASSDHFVRAYNNTYKLPTVISNCSNNYGPNHFPEKLIPLMINNIRNGKPLPVYGRGENVRDWLYVIDHARAIDVIFHSNKIGETFNIGGNNEWKNIDLIHLLIKLMDKKLGNNEGHSLKLISYVTDRAGHDLRYAIDAKKLMSELGWKPSVTFEEGLAKTVDWYFDNWDWVDNITSGSYESYYAEMYANS